MKMAGENETPENTNTGEVQTGETATPAPVETSSDEVLSFDDIENVLAFDPFDEEHLGEVTPPEETPAAAPAAESGAPGTPEETPSEIETPVEGTDELALLKQQLQEQSETIAALQAASQTPPSQQPPQGQDQQAEIQQLAQQYQFNVPDQLLTMLDSEEAGDRRNAIGAIMQGVAMQTHRTVLAQVNEMVQSQLPQMVQGMQASTTQQQGVFNDFYGEYPQLNAPHLRDFVKGVAAEVANASGVRTWSTALRDKIGKECIKRLGQFAPPSAETQTKPPAQPFMAGGAPRGGPGQPVQNEESDIIDTLFGGR
jgi:hypothetical protein